MHCPVMSQATFGCHLGGQILFAIFVFLHMSILFIGMITFVEEQLRGSNYALTFLMKEI